MYRGFETPLRSSDAENIGNLECRETAPRQGDLVPNTGFFVKFLLFSQTFPRVGKFSQSGLSEYKTVYSRPFFTSLNSLKRYDKTSTHQLSNQS